MTNPQKVKNFINGQFVESTTANWIPIISPSDSSTVALVPLSTSSELDVAGIFRIVVRIKLVKIILFTTVKYAQQAFKSWSNLTIKQRAAVMFKFHSLVDAHSQELAEIIVKENGKNIVYVLRYIFTIFMNKLLLIICG